MGELPPLRSQKKAAAEKGTGTGTILRVLGKEDLNRKSRQIGKETRGEDHHT